MSFLRDDQMTLGKQFKICKVTETFTSKNYLLVLVMYKILILLSYRYLYSDIHYAC